MGNRSEMGGYIRYFCIITSYGLYSYDFEQQAGSSMLRISVTRLSSLIRTILQPISLRNEGTITVKDQDWLWATRCRHFHPIIFISFRETDIPFETGRDGASCWDSSHMIIHWGGADTSYVVLYKARLSVNTIRCSCKRHVRYYIISCRTPWVTRRISEGE